jgi:hypothetical protein
MTEKNEQDRLGALLVNEAAQMSPAFSPSLHRRIMQRIGAESSERVPATGLPFRRYSYAAAAAVILIAGVIALLTYSVQTKPKTVARLPAMPTIQNPVATLSGSVSTSLTDARFAYLDRDARNVMHYMADQVDVLPASR